MRAWLQQQGHRPSTTYLSKLSTASLLSHSACAHSRRAIKRQQQQVRADRRAADAFSTSGDSRNDDWDVDHFMQLLRHRRSEGIAPAVQVQLSEAAAAPGCKGHAHALTKPAVGHAHISVHYSSRVFGVHAAACMYHLAVVSSA